MRRKDHITGTRPAQERPVGCRRVALRRAADERGAAMVEFALVLPLLLMVVFGIFQFGIVFRHYLTITDAARVGARAAAVARDTGECAAASTAIQKTVSAADWAVIGPTFQCTPGASTGDPVTIALHYPYSIEIPFVDISPGTIDAKATERVE